jgi:predicted RNase H-like HicB family nuclease
MNKKPSESATSLGSALSIETEQEADGRWIAEIAAIPGVLAYGGTEEQARATAYALALHVIADRSSRA